MGDTYGKEDFLKRLRPGNESKEHFLLKQVGKLWLYEKGVRCIGTEVFVHSLEQSPYGKKEIVDVVGVDYKKTRTYNPKANKLINAMENSGVISAVEKAMFWEYPDVVYRVLYGKNEGDLGDRVRNYLNDKGIAVEDFIRLMDREEVVATLYTVEAKATLQDFKNGFSVAGDYSYVIVPKGLLEGVDVPKGIGVIEVDLELFEESLNYKKSVQQTVRVRKNVDKYYRDGDGKVNVEYHKRYLEKLVTDIGKRNVNEDRYWNPHTSYKL